MKLHFENGFDGVTEINSQRIEMNHEQGVAPYDLTYAAIGGCFYANFLAECEKMKLKIKYCDVEVTGSKRKEVPTMLESVDVSVAIKTYDDHASIVEALENASENCSMLAMVRHVAEVTINVSFE